MKQTYRDELELLFRKDGNGTIIEKITLVTTELLSQIYGEQLDWKYCIRNGRPLIILKPKLRAGKYRIFWKT